MSVLSPFALNEFASFPLGFPVCFTKFFMIFVFMPGDISRGLFVSVFGVNIGIFRNEEFYDLQLAMVGRRVQSGRIVFSRPFINIGSRSPMHPNFFQISFGSGLSDGNIGFGRRGLLGRLKNS